MQSTNQIETEYHISFKLPDIDVAKSGLTSSPSI